PLTGTVATISPVVGSIRVTTPLTGSVTHTAPPPAATAFADDASETVRPTRLNGSIMTAAGPTVGTPTPGDDVEEVGEVGGTPFVLRLLAATTTATTPAITATTKSTAPSARGRRPPPLVSLREPTRRSGPPPEPVDS